MRGAFGLAAIYVLLAIGGAAAQTPAREPFAELEQQVKKQQGGWNGDKSALSTTFDKERRQLGDKFELELLRYIAGDPQKHYWISAFLQEPSYLHGNKPLPNLSLLVMEQGSSLLRDKTDDGSRGLALSFNVIATVLSQQLGFTSLAISHKNDAERLLALSPDWHAYFPAMSEDEFKIYDAVPSDIKSVRSSPDEDSPDRPKARISAGVLNGKALTLPLPAYPPLAPEISGQVSVSIVIDEAGKVIWAHAISGHPALRKPCEDAALNATFPPATLAGKPQKASGVLVYVFEKQPNAN
jgi:hypothetical protein